WYRVGGARAPHQPFNPNTLEWNAASVILAHNHPSGHCEPSQADRDVTQQLVKALSLIDVRVLDHLVVSQSGWESLSRRGWV
uniref:JAB domain-containing protein n=1 Tax=Gammaproteobacteria TaxID=1236 RepID=UPI0030DBD7A1